jgi:PEP-CTERM motif
MKINKPITMKTNHALCGLLSGLLLLAAGTHSAHATIVGNPAVSLDTQGNTEYLLLTDAFTGAGLVTGWQLYDAFNATQVYLQVWRPTAPNTYQLIGQNIFTTAGTGVENFTVTAGQEISVQANDFIGFYHANAGVSTGLIPFNNGSDSVVFTGDLGGGFNPSVGETRTLINTTGRTYSLNATVVVPEPTSALLLLGSGAMLLRRRRRA